MIYIYMVSIVIILSILVITGKNKYTIPFLLCIITVNTTKILGYDFDVFLKFLFLYIYIYYICKYNLRTRYLFIISILCVLFVVNLIFAQFDTQYTFTSYLTATLALFIGLLPLLIKFNDVQKEYILKILIYLPLFSIVIGLILWPLGGLNPFLRGSYIGLAGASEATNLAFFCLIGICASFFKFKRDKIVKYRYFMYINFFFLLCTLTRGGIISGVIIILYDLIPFLKSCLKNKKRIFVVSSMIIISVIPIYFVINQLIARTYGVSGEINTSGRTEAWAYIISLCKNRFIGNGYGFLKTRTEYQLQFFSAAHNEYVHLYTEMGLIGVFTFFACVFQIIRKRIKEVPEGKESLIFVFIVFLIYSIFDNTLTNYCFWFPYMLLISILSRQFTE